MTDYPVMRADVERIAGIRRSFVGARVVSVRYRQTGVSGLAAVPAGESHEVDLDVVFELSSGIATVTWERNDLVEGLAIAFPDVAVEVEGTVSVPADESVQWRSYVGKEVRDVSLGWQVSEVDCPESLWVLRLSFETDAKVVLALGQLDTDGTPTYHPDSIVVVFGEDVARSYEPPGALGSSWGED
jgi:hypothetical protein